MPTNTCLGCKQFCDKCADTTQKCELCQVGYRRSLIDEKACVKDYIDWLEKKSVKFVTFSKIVVVTFNYDIETIDKSLLITSLKITI